METKRFFNLPLFLLTLLTLCCFHTGYGYAATASTTITTSTTLHLPAFSSIKASGPVKIILIGEQEEQKVVINAPLKVAQSVHASVQNHTLIINANSVNRQFTPVLIKISLSQPLNNLSLSNSAFVWGNNISNPNMAIALKDSASIHLQGKNTALHSIQNDGVGNITITDINSEVVIVRGKGNGKVIVSGKTQELNAQIGHSLILEAERLHAETGHIRTQDKATAYVCVLGALHAFAYNNSHIYYYYNPSSLVRDTHASGNVLKITPDRRLVREW